MKINTVVGYLTCLLIVSYLLVMQIHVDEYGDMSRFVPSSALIYLEQHNGSKELNKFKSSLLAEKLNSIDFLAVGEEIGLNDKLLSQVEILLSSGKFIKDNLVFHEIFGKKFAIALMPPVDHSKTANLQQYLKENTLIIAQPRHNAEFLEILAENVGSFKENGSISVAQYGNHQIKRITQSGKQISITIIDGCILISFDERALRRCLDVYDSSVSSLAQDEDFITSKNNFRRPSRFIYLPVNKARIFVSSLLNQYDVPGKDIFHKELKTTEGFSSFSYGAWQNHNIVEDKIVVRYNPHEINKLVKGHVRIPPSKCNTLALVSQNPILYYWSNTLNFAHFLLYLNNPRIPDVKKRKNSICKFELIAGKTISETLSLLGDEVSLIIDKSPNGSQFPIPLGLFLINSSSVTQLKVVMENIMTEYEMPIKSRQYKSAHYSYWKRSFQDGVNLLYGYYNGYFFIGNSTSLLKEVIDSHHEGNDLTENSKVQPIDPGFGLTNNSLMYMNNVELIKVLQDAVDFFGTMMAIKNRETSAKIRLLNKKIVSPLLEGATMYDSSATRSYFIPNGVIVESKTHISH